MYSTREYDNFIYKYKLSSGEYYFVNTYDKNKVVGLIQPTTESAYTPQAEIPDEDVVDTARIDIPEEMEQENGQI